MLPTIVTCFPVADHLIQKIRQEVHGQFDVIVSDQDRIGAELFLADIFCGHAKVPVDWAGITGAGKLKWIQSSAAGLDHCLTSDVIASEILVSGCSGLFAAQVAEQSMALLMGLIRRSPVFFRAQQAREFIRRPTDNLQDKNVLIVGFGGNGQRIARTLRPMVESIIATDIFPAAGQALVDEGIVRAIHRSNQLDQLLTTADVVIVTLPLSEMNEQLLGPKQFGLMKGDAYLINVGRGSVVDTLAMIESLDKGHLAGAGIDVVDPEPLPVESSLWEMDNVIISPHVGAQSPLRVPQTVDLFLKNIKRYQENQSLLNLVDKTLGFPRPEYRIKLN